MARSSLLTRLLPAGALGVSAALLVSCGGGGKGLIPAGNAGPLQTDFNDVAQAVSSGDCHGAESAVRRARHDFNGLPTIDPGLRQRLSDGLVNLYRTVPGQCKQNSTSSTSSSTQTTTTPPATQTTPSTTDTTTTPPTSSPTTTSSQTQPTPSSSSSSGGTPAPANPPTGGTHGPGDGGNGNGKGKGKGGGGQ